MRYLMLISLSCVLLIGWGKSLSAQELIETQGGMVAEGNTLFEAGKYVEAEAVYRRALTEKGPDFSAQFNLGHSLYAQKRYDVASGAFQAAARLAEESSDQADSWYNQGNALLQQVISTQGQADADPQQSQQALSQAIAAYVQALNIQPNQPFIRYNLAYALGLQSQGQGKDNPDLPDPSTYAKELKARADQLIAQKKYGQALQLMQQGLQKDQTVSHYQSFMQRLTGVVNIQNEAN